MALPLSNKTLPVVSTSPPAFLPRHTKVSPPLFAPPTTAPAGRPAAVLAPVVAATQTTGTGLPLASTGATMTSKAWVTA